MMLAAWNFHRTRFVLAWSLTGCAATLVLFGLFVPAAAKRFHKYWMHLAAVLGFVNSRIILTVFYFLVIAPFGTIVRLLGQDPLLRRGKPRESYWKDRPASRQVRTGFERAY
jgi:hypothetical protein